MEWEKMEPGTLLVGNRSGPFRVVKACKKNVVSCEKPIDKTRPFGLRSNYVQLRSNYVQLRSDLCKIYVNIT